MILHGPSHPPPPTLPAPPLLVWSHSWCWMSCESLPESYLQEHKKRITYTVRVLNGFAPNYSSRFGYKLVSCPDPTLPEKKGLVIIRHPAWPSDVSHLACEMTNHSTVSVISSAMRWRGIDNIPYNYGICMHVVTYNGMFVTPLLGRAGCRIVTRSLFLSARVGSGHETRFK